MNLDCVYELSCNCNCSDRKVWNINGLIVVGKNPNEIIVGVVYHGINLLNNLTISIIVGIWGASLWKTSLRMEYCIIHSILILSAVFCRSVVFVYLTNWNEFSFPCYYGKTISFPVNETEIKICFRRDACVW
jgi:hypothetical protein